MAITIYSGVEGLNIPDFAKIKDWTKYNEACTEYDRKLSDWAKENSKHKDAGKVIMFPVADGNASYVVLTHTKLIHVGSRDAYDYKHIERLKATDIKKKINTTDAINKHFGA